MRTSGHLHSDRYVIRAANRCWKRVLTETVSITLKDDPHPPMTCRAVRRADGNRARAVRGAQGVRDRPYRMVGRCRVADDQRRPSRQEEPRASSECVTVSTQNRPRSCWGVFDPARLSARTAVQLYPVGRQYGQASASVNQHQPEVGMSVEKPGADDPRRGDGAAERVADRIRQVVVVKQGVADILIRVHHERHFQPFGGGEERLVE